MPEHRHTYGHIKCETCGVSWDAHTADCSRHRHRPGLPWVERARELRRSWEARRAAKLAELAEQNAPELVP